MTDRDLGPHVAATSRRASSGAPRTSVPRSGLAHERDRRPARPRCPRPRTSGWPTRRSTAAPGCCAAASTSSTAPTGSGTSTPGCSSSPTSATRAGSSSRSSSALARNDRMNEYVRHTGSAVWAVPPGVGAGGSWGQTLLALSAAGRQSRDAVRVVREPAAQLVRGHAEHLLEHPVLGLRHQGLAHVAAQQRGRPGAAPRRRTRRRCRRTRGSRRCSARRRRAGRSRTSAGRPSRRRPGAAATAAGGPLNGSQVAVRRVLRRPLRQPPSAPRDGPLLGGDVGHLVGEQVDVVAVAGVEVARVEDDAAAGDERLVLAAVLGPAGHRVEGRDGDRGDVVRGPDRGPEVGLDQLLVPHGDDDHLPPPAVGPEVGHPAHRLVGHPHQPAQPRLVRGIGEHQHRAAPPDDDRAAVPRVGVPGLGQLRGRRRCRWRSASACRVLRKVSTCGRATGARSKPLIA